eukprot:12743221-Alexandrium_andersonii.AAC.1
MDQSASRGVPHCTAPSRCRCIAIDVAGSTAGIQHNKAMLYNGARVGGWVREGGRAKSALRTA